MNKTYQDFKVGDKVKLVINITGVKSNSTGEITKIDSDMGWVYVTFTDPVMKGEVRKFDGARLNMLKVVGEESTVESILSGKSVREVVTESPLDAIKHGNLPKTTSSDMKTILRYLLENGLAFPSKIDYTDNGLDVDLGERGKFEVFINEK